MKLSTYHKLTLIEVARNVFFSLLACLLTHLSCFGFCIVCFKICINPDMRYWHITSNPLVAEN